VSACLGDYVRKAAASGTLVVQPRMGFGDPRLMRRGLRATRQVEAPTVGTITVDSYTRVGDDLSAARALAAGDELNGYPLVCLPPAVTREVIVGLHDEAFPVQVRHGSARPAAIFDALIKAGLSATEGGPISYCLPYGRVPLRESVANWVRCCECLADAASGVPHLETFGGCLLGQLCPPSLLVAVSVLEAMFFAEHGITDLSLSYAQQVCPEQDAEAIAALRSLAHEFLPDADLHVVLYTYMGVYPRTRAGALALLEESARLAVRTGAERLIVKTVAEAHRIPTITENTQALSTATWAADRAARTSLPDPDIPDEGAPGTGIRAEARAIIGEVLNLADRSGLAGAFVAAFRRGLLDVPFCLHPDNAGATSSYIDTDGRLRWSATGALPIAAVGAAGPPAALSAVGLLDSLSYIARTFDRAALRRTPAGAIPRVTEPTNGDRTDEWSINR
jgi:methylaspartate mutase epsilon subunit